MDGLRRASASCWSEIQRTLFERAVQFREEHTQRVGDYDDVQEVMEGRPGFVIAPWCGSAVCEAQIKNDTQATIRNMPMTGGVPSGRCVRCDQAAQAEAWFAKSVLAS